MSLQCLHLRAPHRGAYHAAGGAQKMGGVALPNSCAAGLFPSASVSSPQTGR